MQEIKFKNFKIKVQGTKYYVVEKVNPLGSFNSMQYDVYSKKELFATVNGIQPTRKKTVKEAILRELENRENIRKAGIDLNIVKPIFDEINSGFMHRGNLEKEILLNWSDRGYGYENVLVSVEKKRRKKILTVSVIVKDEPKKKGRKK
jgi:hypothetical protein